MTRGKKQPVVINGVTYPSHRAAARALGVSASAVWQRVNPEKRRQIQRLLRQQPGYQRYSTKSQFPNRLSLDQAAWDNILRAIEEGRSNNAIAKKFGINHTTVRYIRLHRSRAIRVGEHSPRSKLTTENVRTIRALYASGNTTMKHLAKQFGVTYQAINDIIRRKTWKHIE